MGETADDHDKSARMWRDRADTATGVHRRRCISFAEQHERKAIGLRKASFVLSRALSPKEPRHEG